MDALTRAIEVATGVGELASAIGVTQTAVSNWRSRGVPLAQCPAIERATGIRCHELRPDVTWLRDSDGQVTGYHVPLSKVS